MARHFNSEAQPFLRVTLTTRSTRSFRNCTVEIPEFYLDMNSINKHSIRVKFPESAREVQGLPFCHPPQYRISLISGLSMIQLSRVKQISGLSMIRTSQAARQSLSFRRELPNLYNAGTAKGTIPWACIFVPFAVSHSQWMQPRQLNPLRNQASVNRLMIPLIPDSLIKN